MKIDKSNPTHWLYLVLFGANVALAIVLRIVTRRPTKPLVVLYGHKLCGNLLAIYDHVRKHCIDEINVVFLTMDPAYCRELRAQGDACMLAIAPESIPLLAGASAVVSDHGLHALVLMLGRTDLKFFDVWHGIPFKGFDADDFRVQHRYDEVWVASPLMKKFYVERYGFHPDKVEVTGYARTDRLVRRDEDPGTVRRRLGLGGPGVGKIVLFAPTWKQDARNRSIYPFGIDEQTFFRALSELAQRTQSTFIIRAHLNSGAGSEGVWSRIVHRPHAKFPDTEDLLLVSDILVCDWSSIAFDFLLLDRPAIFLDVEAPFAKGFSLDVGYRYGVIAPGMDQLLQWLERYLEQPAAYDVQFGMHAAQIRKAVYADYADGVATSRCIQRLIHHLQ